MPLLYHVLNRGVDKRKIFLDKQDYYRFIHDLFEFNTNGRVNNVYHQFHKNNDIASRYFERKLLVNIHFFCLMPNHYHLLLSPTENNSNNDKREDRERNPKISEFMKKVNIGYAKYFNQKYKRTGALFEGRYKSIPILGDPHFSHIQYYIHFNPLDLIMPEWRKRKIENFEKAINFLRKYRWSSHLDYLGEKNFSSVTQRDFFLDFFGGTKKYEKSITNWLREIDTAILGEYTLE